MKIGSKQQISVTISSKLLDVMDTYATSRGSSLSETFNHLLELGGYDYAENVPAEIVNTRPRVGVNLSIERHVLHSIVKVGEDRGCNRSEAVNHLLCLGIAAFKRRALAVVDGLGTKERKYTDQELELYAEHPEWCDNDEQRAAGAAWRENHG